MLPTKTGDAASTEVRRDMQTKLDQIAKRASEDKKLKFTSLVHLLNAESLKECFHMLKKHRAPGVDDVTYEEYETYLDTNVMKLVGRMKRQAYHPQPVKRVYIPKADGKTLRPLGIPALEDKIVQMGIKRILSAIYETEFLDCSYGFREGRGCHDALKKLDNAIMTKPVSYIIDADIRGFFDNVDHDCMMKMLQGRIVDPNLNRIIKRFLNAGYMEDGEHMETEAGTPQGGVLSPVLSNIYLHYTLDLWFKVRVKKQSLGYVELIRYADDFVVLVQYREDAEKILAGLGVRLKKVGLDLSVEKTRLIEFGRFAGERAEKQGRKPDTFDFLGFTHYVDKTRKGKFKVGRKTRRKKFSVKLKEINKWLKGTRNMVEIKDWWKVLAAKLRGHYEYYGISGNFQSMQAFYFQVCKLTYKWINRRSQKRSMNLQQYFEYLKKFPLPKPTIRHNIYAFGS